MAKLLNDRELEDAASRALRTLSGSSPIRLAVCELLEHIEALADLNPPPHPKRRIPEVRFRPQPSTPLVTMRSVSNSALALENDRLQQDLDGAIHQIGELLRESNDGVDEHY